MSDFNLEEEIKDVSVTTLKLRDGLFSHAEGILKKTHPDEVMDKLVEFTTCYMALTVECLKKSLPKDEKDKVKFYFNIEKDFSDDEYPSVVAKYFLDELLREHQVYVNTLDEDYKDILDKMNI